MRRSQREYPQVMNETTTMQLVVRGASIGRLGDGEFNHVRGRKNVSQKYDSRLTQELNEFLNNPPKNCIVGIPTMDPKGPKYPSWEKYRDSYAEFLDPERTYGSAFVSRPDSAPWINNRLYFDWIESLWAGDDVTLIANGVRSLKPEFLAGKARNVAFVQCAYRDAYDQIEELYSQCVSLGRRKVIMCAGPTATVMAARFARTKIAGEPMQGIDLGHIGMFWPKTVKEIQV